VSDRDSWKLTAATITGKGGANHVRFGLKANIRGAKRHVHFTSGEFIDEERRMIKQKLT